MSRARLGLYIFGRVSLFSNCFELTPAFQYLMVRPLQLRIIPSERYPPRKERAMKVDVKVIKDMTEMHQFVYNMYIKIVQSINNAEAKKNVPMVRVFIYLNLLLYIYAKFQVTVGDLDSTGSCGCKFAG